MAFTGPLEDSIEINELVVSYGDAVCRRDAEAWGALWAEDSVWEMPGIPGMERTEGKKAIVETWIEGMKGWPFQVNRQALSNLEVKGDSAKGETYTFELVKDKEGKAARWTNRYTDTFVKQDGKWLFKSRVLEILHIGDA